ncbi:hypothetical protein AYO44_13150 [Planctomycetaceae bacterium SCGC AG-212-F19]|nr:hypothetical protein AYO44_13150 [Planctomycetaceae bacterium SCGC AG-212-F19]
MRDISATACQLIDLLRQGCRTRAELYRKLDCTPLDLMGAIDRATQEHGVGVSIGPTIIALQPNTEEALP